MSDRSNYTRRYCHWDWPISGTETDAFRSTRATGLRDTIFTDVLQGRGVLRLNLHRVYAVTGVRWRYSTARETIFFTAASRAATAIASPRRRDATAIALVAAAIAANNASGKSTHTHTYVRVGRVEAWNASDVSARLEIRKV